MRLSRIILIILICTFIAQGAIYYLILPETMASHFNGLGHADNWMSKQVFFIFEGIILLVIIAEFTLLPLLIEKMPDSMINLPKKDFWLAPERRGETFAAFRHFFEWFSVMLLALFIAVNQLVFRANIDQRDLSAAAVWTALAVFVIFVIVWTAKFVTRFRIAK